MQSASSVRQQQFSSEEIDVVVIGELLAKKDFSLSNSCPLALLFYSSLPRLF